MFNRVYGRLCPENLFDYMAQAAMRGRSFDTAKLLWREITAEKIFECTV